MTKRRIITIVTTLLLCGIVVVLEIIWRHKLIDFNPILLQCMLVATAVLVFFGCMLQSLGHPKIAVILGDIVFVILCICVYYCKTLEDVLVFAGCMYIVLRRASTDCECVRKQSCKQPAK